MRNLLRLLTIAASTAVLALGVLPAAQAVPRPVFTVWDGVGFEFYKQCSNTPPYPCGTFTSGVFLQLTMSSRPTPASPITVTYQLQDITATVGQDYQASAATGTITFAPYQTVSGVVIPTVNDGVAESDETFRLRLTGSSVPGTITDTGIGTIWDGGTLPADCDLLRPDAQSFSMTCTNRPAGEQWKVEVTCGDEWPMFVYPQGNVVTGNGTSYATCTGTGKPYHSWGYIVLN